jgi:hypothetical protein
MQDYSEEEEPEEEGQQNSEDEQSDIPEKFKGKSYNELVDMYRNLEKEYGRKGNEVGELRKLTDEILQLEIEQKRNAGNQQTQKKEESLSDDDWFSSPKEATDKYLGQSDLAKEVNELKEKLNSKDREQAHAAFVEKHPDYQQVAQDSGFAEFVTASKYRTDLAKKADAYDYEAANELMDLYKQIRGANSGGENQEHDSGKSDRNEARKKATLEGTGNRNKGTKKVYRRADLIKMKMQDPERYMSMQDEIMKAYQEGRVK